MIEDILFVCQMQCGPLLNLLVALVKCGKLHTGSQMLLKGHSHNFFSKYENIKTINVLKLCGEQ